MHAVSRADWAAALLLALAMLIAGGWVAGIAYFLLIGSDWRSANALTFWQQWLAVLPDLNPSPQLWLSSALPLLGVGAVGVALWLKTQHRPLYGDARFASEADVRRAGLRCSSGVILGRFRGRYLIADGQFGCIVIAPQRSGKGVGFVIPNLLSFGGSVFVTDIRGEAFAASSGFRAEHGDRVILFAPLQRNTHGYNPLDFVSHDPGLRIDDIQKIAFALIKQHSGENPIWSTGARDLFEGLYLFLTDTRNASVTIGDIYDLARSQSDIDQWLQQVLDEYGTELDPACLRSLQSFANKASKEQSGVLTTLQTALALWGNPLVNAATSRTDFDPATLRRRRHAVYLVIPPGEIARLAPLINLMVQQTIDRLLKAVPGKDEPHRVLLLLDEMTAFGRLERLESAMGYLASYNLILAPVIQHRSQLDAVWTKEHANTLLGNSRYRVYFAVNDYDTAAAVSRELGTLTTTRWTRSVHGVLNVGRSQQHHKRDLLSPDDVKRLDSRKMLVLVQGQRPVLADRILYFRTRLFKRRLRPLVKIAVNHEA